MITHLTGELVQKNPAYVIMDVNGVGYEVRISLHTFSTIKSQQSCRMLTYQYIKGDIQALYGFATSEEKQCFLQLININGIGPRIALTVLSSLNPAELEQVINNHQSNVLRTIKGIGDKAAQRIVLELQGKLQQSKAQHASGEGSRFGAMEREAHAALVKLGIAPNIAEKALAKVQRQGQTEDVSVELLIKQALQGT